MAEPSGLSAAREAIRSLLYADETEVVRQLRDSLPLDSSTREDISARTRTFITAARERRSESGLLDSFLQQFGLSNKEGIALLSLAEALLRIPDPATADALIGEKIAMGDWEDHAGQSDSLWVNAATRALMLGQDVVGDEAEHWMGRLVSRLGAPVVRSAVRQAMRVMGDQFVTGETIEAAVSNMDRAQQLASFDMLGEGARTQADAERHFAAYLHAIHTLSGSASDGPHASHGVSIKLSALHPRYEFIQAQRVQAELLPRVQQLALAARRADMHLTIDAEEAARLELSLDIFAALARDPALREWDGLGFAVQCYSKRAFAVLEWLVQLADATARRFMVRLVKGAYWDTEIKRAQELGVSSYPVFTRKVATDVAYLACARFALRFPHFIYPQFATHNAHTIAAVLALAGERRDFEFQRLHGMGELLYAAIRELVTDLPSVRVYAPVGAHTDLLAYLVRRLLENGASTSFVNRFMSPDVSVADLAADPLQRLDRLTSVPHPRIPLPRHIYGDERVNSRGYDLNDPLQAERLTSAVATRGAQQWQARWVQASASGQVLHLIRNPANRDDVVGAVQNATAEEVHTAIGYALAAQPAWDQQGGEWRATRLEAWADQIEAAHEELVTLIVREGGRTLNDALAEVREAVDFCRYYAAQARREFAAPQVLPGPVGERNLYSRHGRGVFVCISPWNFPLAIFVGQNAAALAAGNSSLAKPAEQTPLTAALAIALAHRAGIPRDVLQLLPGEGETVGAALVSDERIAGVAMTGSTATAKLIAAQLAARQGPIVPLIAETGGQNAMFVDSTALPEQVVDDVIRSAFHSTGQRCSALRVLFLQQDIADRMLEMICGAMDELSIGDPSRLSTDVGPLIDAQAVDRLQRHIQALTAQRRLLHRVELSAQCERGSFLAPHLLALESVNELQEEHFGPVLHVVRYRAEDLEAHLRALKATGYGLTLGVHSRIEAQTRRIFADSMAGNVYVNRNMIGAVVGVQPFGGHGLSGTGPKAGGPLYLHRFAAERVLTINTTASGGNAALLTLADDESQ